MRRVVTAVTAAILAVGLSGTYWIASPTQAHLQLVQPLKPFRGGSLDSITYTKDFAPLERGFRAQIYRSFCGPASIATVLRAYGVNAADQTSLFPSFTGKLKAFYTGMTLAELNALAKSSGLRTQLVYADQLNLESFRERLKNNLAREGDFVLVNYDRRVLKQEGMGHISPVAAYDPEQDAFLVLDEAAYRYPFTWVPARLLYAAVHTQFAGQYRGVLFIQGYRPGQ
jgi:glutathione-S-conjugate glycine hydrolase